MEYTTTSGNQVNFEFDNILSGDPNFDFRVFDVVQAIMNNLILRGAIIR